MYPFPADRLFHHFVHSCCLPFGVEVCFSDSNYIRCWLYVHSFIDILNDFGGFESIHFGQAALHNYKSIGVDIWLAHLVLVTLMENLEVPRSDFVDSLLAIVGKVNLQFWVQTLDG